MATVNNVVTANVAKDTGGARDAWHGVWAVSRAMKKAGWKILASADGTSKTVTDDPELDEWETGTITNAGASAASTGAIAGGRMTVTGLTGIVAADKGRFLHLSSASSAGNNHWHQIEEILGATSVRVDARRSAFTPVATDASNGSIVWEILDPTTGTRVALDTTQCWIMMSGPSTLKVPITAAPVDGPTGFTFIRGENVSQATTGAEGEIIGFVFDADGSVGYLTVRPRIIGTGGDTHGWGTGEEITGATSGATVTQVGPTLEYRQQTVFHKEANEDAGHMYHQCIEPVGESADSFETLASAAGCTATIQPGGGGTDNTFPAIAFTSIGNTGSSTGDAWMWSTHANVVLGNAQCIAADAIFEEDYSADGTWAMCIAVTTTLSTATGGVYGLRGMMLMDDGEPGDLDPWITLGGSTATLYSSTARTAANETGSSTFDPDWCSSGIQDIQTTTSVYWRGWRRRGLGTDDAFITCEQAALYLVQESEFVIEEKPTTLDEVATEPVTTIAREPVTIICAGAAMGKTRKGNVRHLTMVQNGNPNRTYDDGKALCLHNVNGAYVITPWDETSIPRSV